MKSDSHLSMFSGCSRTDAGVSAASSYISVALMKYENYNSKNYKFDKNKIYEGYYSPIHITRVEWPDWTKFFWKRLQESLAFSLNLATLYEKVLNAYFQECMMPLRINKTWAMPGDRYGQIAMEVTHLF